MIFLKIIHFVKLAYSQNLEKTCVMSHRYAMDVSMALMLLDFIISRRI